MEILASATYGEKSKHMPLAKCESRFCSPPCPSLSGRAVSYATHASTQSRLAVSQPMMSDTESKLKTSLAVLCQTPGGTV
eukprot:SAG11_NODE_1336_length_5173_cov_10.716791_2_plen_80_part_00